MSVLSVILGLMGGLGLFLYGMKLMSDGLEKVAGAKMRSVLEFFTKNRFVGMLVGVLFTAIIQSSSATTVMVVSFVNSGLMNLMQAAGVIMGANIGTTVTSQLISFNLSEWAPGGLEQFLQRPESHTFWGGGLGIRYFVHGAVYHVQFHGCAERIPHDHAALGFTGEPLSGDSDGLSDHGSAAEFLCHSGYRAAAGQPGAFGYQYLFLYHPGLQYRFLCIGTAGQPWRQTGCEEGGLDPFSV